MAAIVANCAISLNCELTQPVKVQYIDGNMFSMDNAGNTAHVYVFYNGEPQEIVGSVSADVIRSDGTTVAITGAMSGNRAYVIFPQSCYAVPGVVSVVIKVTEGTTVTTIAAFVANVYRSSTDTIVDPGTIIPSVQNLISAIETAVASIPADYSSLWESLAPDYTDITFPVTAGKYCTYNGTLYVAKVDIATTESFTAAHWQSTNIGDNLSALKSALDATNEATEDINKRFDNPNVMKNLQYRNGVTVASGAVASGSANAQSITFDVEANTQYRIVMPVANRSGFAGNNTGIFETGQTYTSFSASVTYSNSYVFTTPANVTSVILYFYNGTYTFDPDGFKLYKGDTIPSDLNVRLKESSLPLHIPFNSVTGVLVNKTQTTFIRQMDGKNIFNPNDADIETGEVLNANGTTTSLSSEAYMITGYIEVLPETDYSVYAGNNSAAQYASDVYVTAQFYDAEKNRIGNAVGTMDNSGNFYTVTSILNAVYMRVNLYNSLSVFMVVKGDTYPGAYVAYSSGFELVGVDVPASGTNPLTGKTILWDGDSICAGKAFNDTHDAWAGRIAANNQMAYKNYAVGGGTITENVVSGGVTKHSVCANLETMHTEFPDADYIVFDGGCNDADLLGSMIGGNTPERLGTFTMSDFSGNYDEDTFCGAFESILYRMTNYWRNAKFAYIIPHKMGILNQYRADYTKEHHNYRAYYDIAIQMCIKWGVKYLDLWDNCFFCPMISHLCDTNSEMTQQEIYDAGMVYADRQHLTEHGYDLEAPMIENWLKTI